MCCVVRRRVGLCRRRVTLIRRLLIPRSAHVLSGRTRQESVTTALTKAETIDPKDLHRRSPCIHRKLLSTALHTDSENSHHNLQPEPEPELALAGYTDNSSVRRRTDELGQSVGYDNPQYMLRRSERRTLKRMYDGIS